MERRLLRIQLGHQVLCCMSTGGNGRPRTRSVDEVAADRALPGLRALPRAFVPRRGLTFDFVLLAYIQGVPNAMCAGKQSVDLRCTLLHMFVPSDGANRKSFVRGSKSLTVAGWRQVETLTDIGIGKEAGLN